MVAMTSGENQQLRFGITDLYDVMLYTFVCKRGIEWVVFTC